MTKRKFFLAAFISAISANIASACDLAPTNLKIEGQYQGECSNGKAHGVGMAKGTNSYTGSFKLGAPDGVGKLVYPDGTFYEGNWSMGKRHGKGLMDIVGGPLYVGDWQNDQRSGTGSEYYRKGGNVTGSYTGEFRQNKRNGVGIFRWTDGSEYYGEYLNNERSGYGRISLVATSPSIPTYGDKGRKVGDKYVVEGIWNEGGMIYPCSEKKNECVGKYKIAEQNRLTAEREAGLAIAGAVLGGVFKMLAAPFQGPSGVSSSGGGDAGREAASWTILRNVPKSSRPHWSQGAIEIRCTQGRNQGKQELIDQRGSNMWSPEGSLFRYKSVAEAATAICESTF